MISNRFKREHLSSSLLLLGGFIVALCLAEVGLHAFDYRYSPLQVVASDYRGYHAFKDKHFVHDPKAFWRPRKGVLGFDSHGYKGKELPEPKPPGEFRILAIGDSNTLGWSGPGEPSWPMYLEQELGRSVRVVNAGVYGYTSYQGLVRLDQALGTWPDLVLVSFGGNDALRVPMSDHDYAARAWVENAMLMLRLGHLALKVRDAIASPPAMDSLVPRVSYEEYTRNLTTMIERCRKAGVQIALLTRPFLGDTEDIPLKLSSLEYNKLTAMVSEVHGVLLIDVYEHFAGMERFFTDYMHFNEEGHKRAARFIANVLRRTYSAVPVL